MSDHTTNETTNEIEPGFCHCGCGQRTPLAVKTSTRDGTIKGQPVRYLTGHQRRCNLPEPNPGRLCMCGCGQPTPLAVRTSVKYGLIEGKPVRFIRGHDKRIHERPDGPNPSSTCMCGCGRTTPIAPQNDQRRGWIKDKPIQFCRGHGGRRPLEERFWEKVDKRGPDECWPWLGATSRKGYGTIGVGSKDDGSFRQMIATRVSWEIHNNPIPDGLLICHACDNPACVNPAHLWLGTHKDNMQDMFSKGRQGQRPRKLDAEIVTQIRALAADGVVRQDLAARFSLDPGTVSKIVHRKIWKHI